MLKRAVAVLSAAVVVLITGLAFAGTYDPGIQDRIADQQRRIDEGIASGQLTKHEAEVLQDNLNWIKAEEARLKRDGRLTEHERKRLNKQLDRNNDMIYKKKHNPARRIY